MLRTVVIAIGLVASAAFVAAATGKVSAAATGPAQIGVSGQQTGYSRVNIGSRRTSPGDMEIIRLSALQPPRHLPPDRAWRARLYVHHRRSRVCRGTYFLPRGNLVVGGSITYREFYELAVLGGTGLFDNARGSLVATRISRTPRREFLLFRLVG